jgi:hypothetical protein
MFVPKAITAQRDRVSCRPGAHAFPLLHHAYEFAPFCVAQRLNDLENNGVPQHRVRDLEVALDHHPFRQFPGRHLRAISELPNANVGDLAFVEEPVANDIACPLALWRREKLDGRIHVGKVMLGVRDLGLIRDDERTKAYAARRSSEGKPRREIVRRVKRYIVREIYRALCASPDLVPAA